MIWIKRLNVYGISNWVILLLFALSIFSTVAQMVGLGIFLPIFEFIFQNGETQGINNQSLPMQYINILIELMGVNATLEWLLTISFLFYLISQVTLFAIAYANAYFLGRMVKNIRNRFFKYYLDANSEYYDKVKIGDFVNISTTELVTAVNGSLAPIRLMVALVSATGSIAILIILSYELTLYIALIIIIMLPYPINLISKTTEVGRANTRFNSTLVSFLLDRLRSPRLVRLSGTRNSEIREYSKITEKQRHSALKIHTLKEKISLIFEPSIIFASLVVIYIAITYLSMPPSSVILFMIITVRLVPIIRAILSQKQNINRAKGAIDSIDSLLSEMKVKESIDNSSRHLNYNNHSIVLNDIILKNISYRYLGANSDTLSNISASFKKSTINAIIGPSGAGKSTLIDVISSYREPSRGVVCFDGLKSSEFKINNLIAYVPQQPQIFDGQIKNHISYGSNNKKNSEIVNAAILSGAHDFITGLDDGYQTILTNNGGNLSGGQKYRVDMARAILSNAPILILDEPTSSLDYKSKNNLIKTLEEIKKQTDKIIIVITHDFFIMPIFDSIVLIEDGKIVGQEVHNKLINISTWYAEGVKNNI